METKPENKIRISPKKKWVLFLTFVLGFYIGLHALYAGRVKKGLFYLLSIFGVILYYGYILSVLKHSWLGSHLHFGLGTWFTLFTVFGNIIQHIPFLGWTAFFGSYLIYLFAFGLLMAFLDFLSILFGRFKDSRGLPIVSESYKQKHANDILFY